MAFTGHEDHKITLAAGSVLTKEFRKKYSNQPKGYYFSKDTLEAVLAQSNCVGIRFYFGADPNGILKIVFSGVVANEDDILGIVGDSGSLCPPACGNANALNSTI